MKKIKTNKGFSLIEILVAMVLLGVLSAIAVPAYNNYRKDANDTVLKSDVGNAYKAYHTWNAVKGNFCATLALAGLDSLVKSTTYTTERQGFVGFGNTAAPTGCTGMTGATGLSANNSSGITATNCELKSDSFKFAVSNKYGGAVSTFSVSDGSNSPKQSAAHCHKTSDSSVKHTSCDTQAKCTTASNNCNGSTSVAGTWAAATSACL